MRFDVEFGGVAPLNAELEISPQTLSADMGTVVQVGSKVEIDPVPTEGSENAVSSGGVFEALTKKANVINAVTGEITPSATANALAINHGITDPCFAQFFVWTEQKSPLYAYEVVECHGTFSIGVDLFGDPVYPPGGATYTRHDSVANNGTLYSNLILKITDSGGVLTLKPSNGAHTFHADVPYKWMIIPITKL